MLDFIAQPGGPREAEALALELFAWQRSVSPLHERFAGAARPRSFQEIPAVPVSLCRDLRFCIGEPGVIFRTSGTTAGRRGEHAMVDARVYEASLQAGFRRALPSPPARCVSLCPAAADSSLGHMMRTLYPQQDAELQQNEPVFLATTGLAALELLEQRWTLAPGSVVMVTGGFKGRRLELQPQELDRGLRQALGPHFQRLDEYGMTELCSPLWGAPGHGYEPAPWCLPYTVDPASGEPCDGVGLLRFVDLASWSSLLAIETEDLGEIRQGRVFLHGRLEGAPPRGCSLVAEEALGAS